MSMKKIIQSFFFQNRIDGKGKTDDPHFNYNMTILIGCSAEVTTRTGEVYEGIYVAFSQDMEILLEAAHLVTDNKDDSSIDKHFDVLVIPSEKVCSIFNSFDTISQITLISARLWPASRPKNET